MNRKILVIILLVVTVACNQNTKTEDAATADTVSLETVTSNGDTTTQLPAGPAPNTVMTEEYVKSMTKLIYLWAWPMVNVHNRVTMLSAVKEPIYVGGVI